MPTAVLDFDIKALPTQVEGLGAYRQAVVLIRHLGRPLTQVLLPVVEGRIDAADLRQAVVDSAGVGFWRRTLDDYLNLGAPSPATLPSATVAICTRDRPEDLSRCLHAVTRLPDDGQEILVVDNCPSNEATCQLVQQFPMVRYIREMRPGLDNARNRALVAARGEVVAFTDDDAVPDSAWLRALLKNFTDPVVMCVTGLIMPLELETEAQEWFERCSPMGRGFRRRVFSKARQNPLAVGPVGAGASMALRRSVLDQLGSFAPELDGGTPTRSGGDHEMFIRILTSGYKIVYEPEALSWHRHRRTWDELRRTLYSYGVGVYAGWTHSLIERGEWGVFKQAWSWLRHDQLPRLGRALLGRPTSQPLDLILAELYGCATGPWAYLRSRRASRVST
jgi:glycosyltransferase involved in cell wall biosynthesis